MILVVNAGSSSIKIALFDGALAPALSGAVSEIGGAAMLELGDTKADVRAPDHEAALARLLEGLEARGFGIGQMRAAAHRIVHGGAGLVAPVRLTHEVLAQIDACTALAPLHNPHNLSAVHALAALAPDLPQFGSFDTAFHATNPDVATRYAVPTGIAARGIRRYGFHGISYASLVQSLPEISGAPLPRRLLALHLGNGASICAIREGRSVATSMGYSPVAGLPMGSRSGDIDANAVLRLAEEDGIDATHRLLNSESGLRGLSGGESDMRALLADTRPESRFAVEHFCYWAVRHAGGLIAAMEGVDAIAFTGGIGENAAPVRARIAGLLGWLGVRIDAAANAEGRAAFHADGSPVTCWIVPAREERLIAADAMALLEAG